MFKLASVRRLVLVLSLGLVLAPAASAATLPWADLLQLLSGKGWGELEKHGCSIDPGGQPICPMENQQPAPRRLRSVRAKHGCSISPDGQPVCQ